MQIKISGISDEVIIGYYDYEKHNKQSVILDLICELYSSSWYSNDNLTETVDYDELADFAKILLSKKPYNLLEGLSQFIAREILNKFALIKTIHVDLVKPALCGIKAREIKISYTLGRTFKVALALGSNHIYLPQQQIITAIEMLGEYLTDIKVGYFYRTVPVGGVTQKDFINTALTGFTNLMPQELLAKIKTIEKLMGKEEQILNGPRIIDIDIILFDNLIYKHNYLQIPHRDMHNRDFVLVPLVDVAPKWVHPQFNKTLTELCDLLLINRNSNILEQIDYYKDEQI